MLRICLLALIGLPGAGKTCLSNWMLQQQADLGSWNVLHVCYDDYFHNDKDHKRERDNISQLLIQIIETIRSRHNDPLLLGLPAKVRRAMSAMESDNYLIVCDDNHYYRSMRYKLYQLSRVQNCIFAQIYVATPLAACLLANGKRGSDVIVPEAVIRQMQTRLEEPSTDAWSHNSLTLTDSDYNAASHSICDFIKSLLCQTPPTGLPEVRTKEPQLQSLAHNLDLKLRARIQAKMQQTMPTIPKAVQSHTLNEQRKQILAQFRLDSGGRQAEACAVNLEYYVNLLN
ncbi:L-seryl-tRNA(Sec) kinase [Drosophila grimshawi]|uniref:GH24035 n=1 Tax=Drosophila grimshawi TaxID=7222 RepID=B4JMF1_DROGR|nr:L-seryl-tRNA(Sec) kinase [Drosophila grimshawi]EDV92476.1 GH24035 [Drosophila grimshawi]